MTKEISNTHIPERFPDDLTQSNFTEIIHRSPLMLRMCGKL